MLREGAGPILLKMVNNIPAVFKEICNTVWALTITIMAKFLKGSSKTTNAMEKGYVVFRDDTTKSGTWLGDEFVKKDRLKNVTRYLQATYPSYKKSKTFSSIGDIIHRTQYPR